MACVLLVKLAWLSRVWLRQLKPHLSERMVCGTGHSSRPERVRSGATFATGTRSAIYLFAQYLNHHPELTAHGNTYEGSIVFVPVLLVEGCAEALWHAFFE